MDKIRFAVLGMGDRGTVYASKILQHPEETEITAIADVRQERLDKVRAYISLPDDRVFHSAEELLAQPKLADILVIATQDQQHCAHAVAAIEKAMICCWKSPLPQSFPTL